MFYVKLFCIGTRANELIVSSNITVPCLASFRLFLKAEALLQFELYSKIRIVTLF